MTTDAPPSYAHGTDPTPLLGDTIGENLGRAVAAFADREVLVDLVSGRRWTYAQFDADVNRLARGLLLRGVLKGDRVGIWAGNCPEWLFVQYATARIGAVMVNVNPAYRAHELTYVLRRSGVSVLIAATGHRTTDYRALVRECEGDCPQLRTTAFIGERSWEELLLAPDPELDERLRLRAGELSCDDPVNIQYTSGTTGFPKGAT
ncbi:AMP-binding protein, partial [Streptomyces sp. NPDC002454]